MASSSAPEDVIRTQLLDFCRVAKSLERHEVYILERLVEGVKMHVKNKCMQLLADSRDQAVLWSFQSDATSLKTSARKDSIMGESHVRRRGRVLHEILLQRGFLKTKSTLGVERIALMISDVLLLTAGKKGWNLFAAAAQFFPLARKAGHRGICVQHTCADRAMFSTLDRKLRQRNQAYYTEGMGPDLGDDAVLLELTDWVVSTGCVCHDCHNGLKWGLSKYTSVEGLKDMHIVLESLRNSFTLLVERLPAFLEQHLAFSADSYDVEEVLAFWRCMGIGADMLEAVAEVNPWWSAADGHLWVNGRLADDSEATEKVSHILLYLFKWRKFTESRWITIGPACRSLLWGLCVGLERLVAMTRADPKATDFHLHGFAKLSMDLKRYAVVASLVSYVPDAMLAEVVADDRVALMAEQLLEVLADEVSWVQSLPSFTWTRLISLLGSEVELWELQHQISHACNVASAYIHQKTFRVVNGYPWKLTQGDIDSNLTALAASEEEIRDSCTHKIRTLRRMGFSAEKLVEAVSLLREVQWSSVVVEQAHASCTVMHRFHPEYSGPMLATRSTLHQCRALFQTDPEDSKEARRTAKLVALQSKNPFRVSGRHAFLGTLLRAARETLPSGAKIPQALKTEAVRQHGKMFKLLPPEEQDAYTQEALATAHTRDQVLKEDIKHFRDGVHLRKTRLGEELLTQGLLNRTSAVRFTAEDYRCLVSIDQSLDRSAAAIGRLRSKAMSPPEAPPADAIADLRRCPIYAAPLPARRVPDWLRLFCHNRDQVEGTVLATSQEEGSKAVYFLFATQNPLGAAFLPVTVASPTLPCLSELQDAALLTELSGMHPYVFEAEVGCYTFDNELPFGDAAEVIVFQDVTFEESGALVSCIPPMALSDFVARLPKQATEPTKKRKAKKAAADSSDEDGAAPADTEAQEEEKCEEEEECEEEESEAGDTPIEAGCLPDEVLDRVWRELAEKRKEWGLDSTSDGDDFVTQIRGGAWAAAHVGKVCYAMDARAKKAEPTAWSSKYGLNKLVSFSFRTHGETAAAYLSCEWCTKMQHFYNIWRGQPLSRYVFSPADVASYQYSDSWAHLKASLPLQSPTRLRVEAIESMAPGAPK
jgi:hypothetical protein